MKNSYLRALFIAKKCHKNKLDLSNKPYINHPIHVSKCVKGKKLKIVALLHDVLEDSNIKLSYLQKYFSKDICDALQILTKCKNEEYSHYIYKVSKCELAKQVKIKDLEHNMSVSRLEKITRKDIERIKKYLLAYRFLKNAK